VTTIQQKNFLGHVQKFLQGFQFRINICIEPVRTASTRVNPQRKTASTLVIHSHDPDLIRVKMSRMGGNLSYSHKQQVFEPGPYKFKTVSTRFHPYQPGSTRIDPHRSMCQLLKILGATTRRRKHFGHVQNFYASQTVQKSVLNPFRSLSTRM
jgi:hypothetical protein